MTRNPPGSAGRREDGEQRVVLPAGERGRDVPSADARRGRARPRWRGQPPGVEREPVRASIIAVAPAPPRRGRRDRRRGELRAERRALAGAAGGGSASGSPVAVEARRTAPRGPRRRAQVPATATTSPGARAGRGTAARPSRSPSAVTAIVSVAETVRSPPTTAQPGASRRTRRGGRRRAARARRGSRGRPAPRAARSAARPSPRRRTRFTAADFQPRSCGDDHASRKSGPCTSMSVVTTDRPSGAAMTAASSPGPMSAAGAGELREDALSTSPR